MAGAGSTSLPNTTEINERQGVAAESSWLTLTTPYEVRKQQSVERDTWDAIGQFLASDTVRFDAVDMRHGDALSPSQ